MSTAVNRADPRLKEFRVTDEELVAVLLDGRVVTVPLAWSWRLAEATREQRERFEILGDGQGVHWPEIDEDIGVEGMLFGVPAPRPGKAARKPGAGPRIKLV